MRSILLAVFMLALTVFTIVTEIDLSFWQTVGIILPVTVIICMVVPEEGEK